ncbi:MAG: ATP-binding protein [Myxococcota bacterium]|nr:ATP-binding protein [Myxococcota bacterium]
MRIEHDGFSLVDLADLESLREVCGAFRDLFGLSVRVLGRDGGLLADAVGDEGYCGYIRGFADGRARCGELRGRIKQHQPVEPEQMSVKCFSGCAYEVVPVQHAGEAMGRIVFGPYLPAEIDRLPTDLLRLDPGIDQRVLAQAAASLRRVPRETLGRIVRAFLGVLDLILHSGYRAAMISDAHITAIQESYREVTEKNKALQSTTERLQEMDRLKSNFLAAVSHELRTPLTSIIGYSEMLAHGLGGPLTDEQRQFVRTILEKGEHLLSLISSVIDLSTLDAGRLALHREPVDVLAVCTQAAEKVRSQTPRRDVTVQLNAHGRPPFVHADPELIEKTLVHLVDNAVKFSPPSGVVSIDVRVAEPQPDREGAVGFVLLAPLRRFLAVSVRDSGPGIPEEERARIFEAFYQMDGSATRAHGGLGLGLALVRQFIHAHGGRVEVDGEPGKGSVFRVLLPIPPGASMPADSGQGPA